MSGAVARPRTPGLLAGVRGAVLPLLTPWKIIAAIVIGAGVYASWVRFAHGLGASTHLSDARPWGLWVGFDVLCGVGLAAGGFTITAAVHIFGFEKLKPITRPTVLTAFLGYILVSGGLLYDIGKPWNIWHPLVMWNPHSVMFEVSWCVMLYTTVLTLEFSPLVFQKFGWTRPLRIVKRFTIVLVVAGVLLSTMHQSSLGTVFLIFPTKLHPLWYSTALPIFFFVSAIAAGLGMVIFESYLSNRFLGHRLKLPVLQGVAVGSVPVLAVLLVLRLFDLVYRGAMGYAFQLTPEAGLFAAEILVGIVLPMLLFLSERVRRSRPGLFIAATLVVLGFIMNRLNVSLTAFEASSGVPYFPSWQEIAITGMLVAIGFLAFGFAARHLSVYEEAE